MDWLLAALEATPLAQTLRASRWAYAAVNTAHIFGIALTLGATAALNLRLLGLWQTVPQGAAARMLVPVAAVGLALAAGAGLVLFSVRAAEYAALGVLQAKLALVAIGTLAALRAHLRHGYLLETMDGTQRTLHAAVSLACWFGAAVCGRLIAFAGP